MERWTNSSRRSDFAARRDFPAMRASISPDSIAQKETEEL